jgi:hypothetical protein
MRATAKFVHHADPRRRNVIEASVIIFEGDPATSSKPPLFFSSSHQHSDDLDIQLAEAERLGRIFLTTLVWWYRPEKSSPGAG